MNPYPGRRASQSDRRTSMARIAACYDGPTIKCTTSQILRLFRLHVKQNNCLLRWNENLFSIHINTRASGGSSLEYLGWGGHGRMASAMREPVTVV